MEDNTTPVEALLERARTYTKTSIQLFKLKATAKLAEMTSNLASGLAVLLILILFFVNLNIGISLLIGESLEKMWLGFVIVSGVYACIGFVVYLFRNRWIKKPVSESIISQLLKDVNLKDDKLSD